MKNLSIVFFFLMTFAFMSVNAQAQTDCKTKTACKKVCNKKATTQAKAATNTVKFLNVNNSTKEAKKTSCQPANCNKPCKPANCNKPCNKKGAKAATTSVTAVNNEASKKEPVAALKPKSN